MRKIEEILSGEKNFSWEENKNSEKKISQKIIDYAIWYYLNFFPSKKKIFEKLKEKFWPDSEKWKKYWWISDEEINFIIEEKLKNLLQEENILKAKIKNFLWKWKNLNYIKTKLFEKKFDKNDIEKILNEEYFENPEFIDNWWSFLNKEKLEKNILSLKNKWKSRKFIQQKFCERSEDFEVVNEILEKIFCDNSEFENLKKEYEKIKNKKIKWEIISKQKIIEKLLGKWFAYDDVKKIFEE